MSIRGQVVVECDAPKCHAETIYEAEALVDNLLADCLSDDGWELHDEGYICAQCLSEAREDRDRRDDSHEREAARARNNDFEDTGGRDWT